jgi:hypothetical protein
MRQNPGNQYKKNPEDSMGSTMGSTSTAVCLLLQSSIKFIKVKLTISILRGAITGFNPSNQRQKRTSGLINHSEQSSCTSSCILPIFALDLHTAVKKTHAGAIHRFSFSIFLFPCDARASLVDASKTLDVSIASCVGSNPALLSVKIASKSLSPQSACPELCSQLPGQQ